MKVTQYYIMQNEFNLLSSVIKCDSSVCASLRLT